jgi:hypothetical protein
MAILPKAIAPRATFAINLRFLYLDDEPASQDPDRGPVISWRSTDRIAQGRAEHGINGELWPTKGEYKRVRFGHPMEDFVIRRLARVASDPTVPSMRGQVMQEAVLKLSGAGCAGRGYPRCPIVDQDKPHRRSPNP